MPHTRSIPHESCQESCRDPFRFPPKMRVPDELIHLDSPEPVRLRRPALGLNAGDTVIIVRVQYTPKSGTGAVSLAVVEDIVAFKGGLILGSLRAEDVVVDRAP